MSCMTNNSKANNVIVLFHAYPVAPHPQCYIFEKEAWITSLFYQDNDHEWEVIRMFPNMVGVEVALW